ncbi:MAG: ABC transporter ATP-binding protein [Chloroflexi bacterium]|nr:ABC transporter ATP-binding protein [Chloroflexota bacterium]
MNQNALEVENLSVEYTTRGGPVFAVNNVSFELKSGETIGIVGESGCGKTSLALSLMRILPDNAQISSGRIILDGVDVVAISDSEMRQYRWTGISMIFQAAMNSLNPVYTVGDQLLEAIEAHERITREDAFERIEALFDLVGLDPVLTDRYPHELSGGMRQRAVIAMSLASDPSVIVADEPTTALDVIVQERILRELQKIQQQRSMSMIYISHDLAVIAEVSDYIGVMYAGRMVEYGPANDIFANPTHPYTKALLDSVPSVKGPKRELVVLEGELPDLMQPATGCPFAPRCNKKTSVCTKSLPMRIDLGGRWVDCFNPLVELAGAANE